MVPVSVQTSPSPGMVTCPVWPSEFIVIDPSGWSVSMNGPLGWVVTMPVWSGSVE